MLLSSIIAYSSRGCFYVILVNGNALNDNIFLGVLPPPDDRFPLKIGEKGDEYVRNKDNEEGTAFECFFMVMLILHVCKLLNMVLVILEYVMITIKTLGLYPPN